MKKTVITVSIFAALSLSASAQSMSSLFIPVDPVAASVAGSTVSREATAFAAADNASAMSFSQSKFRGAVSYGIWEPDAADSKTVNAGAYYRIGSKAAVGFTGTCLIDREMDITGSTGVVTGSFTPKDIIGRLGFSYLLTDYLSVGASAKLFHSAIGPELSGTAFGGDISAMYSRNSLNASLALCNLGTSINYGGESYSMPMYARAGAAYSIVGVTVSAEADYIFEGAFGAALGTEYNIADIAFLRAGYHYGAEGKGLPSFASVGLGLKYFGIEFNAACLLASQTLGGTLLFGLGYSF